MRAVEALQAARAAGVEIALAGDDLALEASSPPPETVLRSLSRNKAGIIDLLRAEDGGWSPMDWRAFFEERAGIAEYDGGMSRPEAEALALACCVSEWLNLRPRISQPDRCASCQAGEVSGDPLIPFGTESNGHTWLHQRCWNGWYDRRKAQAVAALANMGIPA